MRVILQVLEYLRGMLPGAAAALALFVCLLPWRRRCLRRRGLTSGGAREAGLLLLAMFSGGMAVLTLCPHPAWLRAGLQGYWSPYFGGRALPLAHRVNLIPFSQGDSLFNIVGNVVMFLPFGFLAALLWRGWTGRRALCAGLGITAGIECWQVLVGRFFDIDDIILNALGVFCGFLLWRGLRRLAPGLAGKFHVDLNEENVHE
ncbi:VanZ family protein [Oscillibacter sp. 1-3]|uniref:VanZ family protein n=1 Tax=Oscillibacter sp. 1-3 TaxID=1235797 RepID=UPI000338F63F|nr:VanZ family protein [Oscillibacter sp. 1-3]EOS66726.1 hypothetical protein C816_00872 [Oscillibacter sp. 1-3]MCI9512538.1 VanZ family protein [Oscillibacter sp.]